jgi:hypothetical protein
VIDRSLGNAYIRGDDYNGIYEAWVMGTIWGGVSGSALEGLGAAFSQMGNIPWTTDYSGIPGKNEVPLGEAFSRLLGRHISDYIAEQGITNAQIVLVSALSSTINSSLLPRSAPLPMYTGSFLTFDGSTLRWVNEYSDNSSTLSDSWNAQSGPYGNGHLPNGLYNGDNLR